MITYINASLLQQNLHAISEQVVNNKQAAERLSQEFPDAAEHIHSKQEEAQDAWSSLLQQTQQKKTQLVESENLQSYFSDFRELMYFSIKSVLKCLKSINVLGYY